MKAFLICCALGMLAIAAPAAAPQFGDFAARLDQYLKLRGSIRDSLPKLRSTKNREEIVDRRQALAKKIREFRAAAVQGDIFDADNVKYFRLAITTVFDGANATNVRKTVRQGEPVTNWKPAVNSDFPDRVSRTTLPPTLLMNLPVLPDGLAYRLVGRDFVLCDTDANLVVDFIPGALP